MQKSIASTAEDVVPRQKHLYDVVWVQKGWKAKQAFPRLLTMQRQNTGKTEWQSGQTFAGSTKSFTECNLEYNLAKSLDRGQQESRAYCSPTHPNSPTELTFREVWFRNGNLPSNSTTFYSNNTFFFFFFLNIWDLLTHCLLSSALWSENRDSCSSFRDKETKAWRDYPPVLQKFGTRARNLTTPCQVSVPCQGIILVPATYWDLPLQLPSTEVVQSLPGGVIASAPKALCK